MSMSDERAVEGCERQRALHELPFDSDQSLHLHQHKGLIKEMGKLTSDSVAICLNAPTDRSNELPLLHVGHSSLTVAVTVAPLEIRII